MSHVKYRLAGINTIEEKCTHYDNANKNISWEVYGKWKYISTAEPKLIENQSSGIFTLSKTIIGTTIDTTRLFTCMKMFVYM